MRHSPKFHVHETVSNSLSPKLGLRSLSAALVLTVVSSLLFLAGGAPANAAAGDYSLTISAPTSVVIGAAYNYTVQITASASAADPAEGIILTTVLPFGVSFDSVPTGASSPVQSATYDAATRTVVFTLKPLSDPLSTFVYSVKQQNNNTKSDTTVLTTSITGTDDSAGPVSSLPVSTGLTGDYDYIPIKNHTTVVGSGNRDVTFYFDVQTGHAAAGTTFAIDSATITDVIAAGAEVISQSSDLGTWTIVGQTATWTVVQNYGPSGARLTAGRAPWLIVRYPEALFPNGTLPPVNRADLSVTGTNGKNHDEPFTTDRGPELGPAGNGTVVGISKSADGDAVPGYIFSAYHVANSWLSGAGTVAQRMVVEDSATAATNADYVAHTDINALSFSFNQVLKSAAVPFTVEYTTTLNPAYTAYTGALNTSADSGLQVVRTGSWAWTDQPRIELELGARLTGWRVVLSPAASDAVIPSGSQIDVDVAFVASSKSLVDGSSSTTPIVNTATNTVTPDGGAPIVSTSTAATLFAPGVYVTTNVVGPSSLNVGDSAVFTAGIVNQHPTDTYAGSQLRVVLPFGVRYDESVGAKRVQPTLNPGVLAVPDIGDGVTVTTDLATDPVTGESLQVVIFTFAQLPPMREPGTTLNMYEEGRGFQYTVPVVVLAQAYDRNDETAQTRSYAQVNDPAYAAVNYRGYGPFWSADTFNFDPQRGNIARADTVARVNTAGGLLLGKLSSSDGAEFGLSSNVQSPGTGFWQVYVSNVLPGPVEPVLVFDRLPYVGDAAGSDFATPLVGPVSGAPDGAVVEYSTDATSASTGTWTTTAVGATAFRVRADTLASGAKFTLLVPIAVGPDQTAGDVANNVASAEGIYTGAPRAFTSNAATMVIAARESISLVKTTNGIDVTAAPGPAVAVGSDVTWGYLVTNTGTVELDDVTLGDDIEGDISAPASFDGSLAPGESVTFTATAPAVAGQYANIGTASGTPEGSTPITVTDPSWYTGVVGTPEVGPIPGPAVAALASTGQDIAAPLNLGAILLLLGALLVVFPRRVRLKR